MTDQLDWETSPIWLWDRGSAPIRPTQQGTDRVDVLVVGAGLAGTATAYYLAAHRPDLRVMLVEASQVGLGATGRSTGIIGPGLGMPMRSLRRRYGDVVAAEAFASTLDGTAEIGRLIAAEGIDCDARLEHQVIGALTERQERRIRRHTRDLAELGFQVRWRDRNALADQLGGAYRAAFAYENVLLVDPYRLVTGLAAAAERRGVRIAERTRVTRLETLPDGVRAHTPGGMIEADHVLLAVDGYGAELNPHPSSVVAVRTHVVATSPLTPDQRAALGWDGVGGVIDQRNFFSYYRLGAGGRLVFGGGPARVPSGDPQRDTRTSAAVFDRVVQELHLRFPALTDVPIEARWSGLTGGTLDRLPVVGAAGDNQRVHFAGGWCGHGLSLCVSTAQSYARVLADGPSPAPGQTLPWFRTRAAGLPAALRSTLPAYLRVLDAQDRIAGRPPTPSPPAASRHPQVNQATEAEPVPQQRGGDRAA
jgi:glycine/D-amino acid oxidase-like deaminating enzyme